MASSQSSGAHAEREARGLYPILKPRRNAVYRKGGPSDLQFGDVTGQVRGKEIEAFPRFGV